MVVYNYFQVIGKIEQIDNGHIYFADGKNPLCVETDEMPNANGISVGDMICVKGRLITRDGATVAVAERFLYIEKENKYDKYFN